MPGWPMPACSMPKGTAFPPIQRSRFRPPLATRTRSGKWRGCGSALGRSGCAAWFHGLLAGEGGSQHDRLRNEAEASGVFGVPTFVFEGELFWGGDRIGLLRERLDEKGGDTPACLTTICRRSP
jgi:DSBA-like thioredoxin domain